MTGRMEGIGRRLGGLRFSVLSVRLDRWLTAYFHRKPPAAEPRHPGGSDPLNQLAADYAEAGVGFVGSLQAILELARRRDDQELLGHLRWVRAALIHWEATSGALEAARSKP